MRTLSQLSTVVLNWAGDAGDTGLLLTIAKDALNNAQLEFCNAKAHEFMLYPATETLTLAADVKTYGLHEQFGQMLWAYNADTDEFMEEFKPTGVLELEENPYDATSPSPNQFQLTSLMPVKRQPATAGVLTLTPGTSEPSCTVRVKGVTSAGLSVSESVSLTTTTNTTNSYAVVTDLFRESTGSYALTVTDVSGNTMLTLAAGDTAKQFRAFELLKAPTGAVTVAYRFYMKPQRMSEDNDVCMVPEDFDQILVYKALLSMQGFIRSTPNEIKYWTEQLEKLENACTMAYSGGRSLGARPKFIQYRPRF